MVLCEIVELVAGQNQHFDLGRGDGRFGAREAVKEAHLANEIPLVMGRDVMLSSIRHGDVDADFTAQDEVNFVTLFAD